MGLFWSYLSWTVLKIVGHAAVNPMRSPSMSTRNYYCVLCKSMSRLKVLSGNKVFNISVFEFTIFFTVSKSFENGRYSKLFFDWERKHF